MDQANLEMINSILHEKFEVPKELLRPEAKLKDDLSLDSLDFVDMIVLLESKTGKSLPMIDFLTIRTLGDIYALVEKINRQQKSDS